MNLDEMCIAAARLSDRLDEFEKTDGAYEDDAELYFNVFRDAINEAYFDVARRYGRPEAYQEITVPSSGVIDLISNIPNLYSVKRIMNENCTAIVDFGYRTRYEIRINDLSVKKITVHYAYLPDRLEVLTDEPEFPESLVDPMVYISLAVARVWLSEKKIDLYNTWMAQYMTLIRAVKGDLRSSSRRRIPRQSFR